MTERLVIVGGDAAGMSAATHARRRKTPDELEIVAFERGNYSSYSACGIPYFVGDIVTDVNTLVVRTPAQFAERNDITVHIRHEVTGIDLDSGQLRLRDRDAGVPVERRIVVDLAGPREDAAVPVVGVFVETVVGHEDERLASQLVERDRTAREAVTRRAREDHLVGEERLEAHATMPSRRTVLNPGSVKVTV